MGNVACKSLLYEQSLESNVLLAPTNSIFLFGLDSKFGYLLASVDLFRKTMIGDAGNSMCRQLQSLQLWQLSPISLPPSPPMQRLEKFLISIWLFPSWSQSSYCLWCSSRRHGSLQWARCWTSETKTLERSWVQSRQAPIDCISWLYNIIFVCFMSSRSNVMDIEERSHPLVEVENSRERICTCI